MAKKSVTTTIRPRSNPLIFECIDSDVQRLNATRLIKGDQPRDPQAMAARLVTQFIEQNRGILSNFDIQASQDYDGSAIWLVLKTGIKAGAFPLLSPTSGKPEYAMVIKPRFEWAGIGSMCAQMGWRIVPTLLKLPLISGTERKVPPWVLSSIVLIRVRALLDRLERRFELIQSIQPAPKGTVNWPDYATRKIPNAQFLQISCQYPDLRDDRALRAAVHFTLRKQLAGLESQRNLTGAVLSLIDLCQSLIRRVAAVPPQRPSAEMLQSWLTGTLRVEAFREGVQAVEWTVEDRGLAGLADMQGLPWVLPMDTFFEAWVETLVTRLARDIGGILRTGRKKETLVPIHWDNAFSGTQKYLLPDVILECDDVTYIFDAKYKRHWEEFNTRNWVHVEKEIQEQHRQDLLQVLAYSTLKASQRVVACLIYPCQNQTWESLKRRGRLFQCGSLPAGGRNLEIILTAVPMNADIGGAVETIKQAVGALPI
jgi:McrBC 5-methylcytosine restriction system component